MTKEELRSYRDMKREQRQLEQILDDLDGKVYCLQAQNLSGMPAAQHVHGESRQERAADKLMDARDGYRTRLNELIARMLAIETAIEALPARQRLLMRARYIEGKSWEKVAAVMGLSVPSMHRIHARALRDISEK